VRTGLLKGGYLSEQKLSGQAALLWGSGGGRAGGVPIGKTGYHEKDIFFKPRLRQKKAEGGTTETRSPRTDDRGRGQSGGERGNYYCGSLEVSLKSYARMVGVGPRTDKRPASRPPCHLKKSSFKKTEAAHQHGKEVN